jgi:hypothetical protein
MISSTLLNLIVSIVAVGVLVCVPRVAHLAAGGRFEEPSPQAHGHVVRARACCVIREPRLSGLRSQFWEARPSACRSVVLES